MRRIGAILVALATAAIGLSVSTGSASAASSSGGTITIGQMVTETNPQTPGTKSTDARDTLQAWAKQTNAAGGINGMKVKVIALDDASDPAKASANVKELISDGAVAIVGESTTATLDQWAPVAAQAGVPVIGGGCYSIASNNDENFFCVTTTAVLDGLKAQVKYVADQGGKVFGETYASNIPAAAQAGPLFESLAKQNGLGFSQAIGTTVTQPDYTAACVTFKQSNTTDVGIEGAPLITPIARDCARQNYYPKWTSGDGQISQNAWVTDPNVKQAIAAVYSFPYTVTKGTDATQTASLKQFHTAMDKYAPKVLKGDAKQPATTYWTAAQAFAKAASTIPAGTAPTAALIKDGLYTFSNETLGGLAPNPITFTKGQPHPHNSCWWGMVLKNHKITVPEGMKTTCTP
jgi:branched-chain amino acid transport system substrate-binding protein